MDNVAAKQIGLIGNNTLILNPATMQVALSYYLSTVLLKDEITDDLCVDSIEYDSSQGNYKIKISAVKDGDTS